MTLKMQVLGAFKSYTISKKTKKKKIIFPELVSFLPFQNR